MDSLKIVLVCSAVLSLGLVLMVCVPLVIQFSLYEAPILWSSFSSWLKPPYLYVILNCIILTIAASSRFHHNHHHQDPIPPPKVSLPDQPDYQFNYDMKVSDGVLGLEDSPAATVVYEQAEAEEVSDDVFEDKSTVAVSESLEVEKDDIDDDFVISKSSWVPSKKTELSENVKELLLPAEKPLVSARFGHRKTVKASPEGGRALRVSKPKRHETLENTWKMITEGRPMPLTRHSKKADSFDYSRQGDPQIPKKLETFKDRTNYQPPPLDGNSPATKLRKEPSLSQDELNRRVEAFIKKFNDEMRMQRQASLNQYREMISR